MTYTQDDTLYIQNKDIHYLFDDLCRELVTEQPSDYKNYIVDFLKKRKEAQ
ncbi:hypothetical protein DIPPA_23180 [Diplonema papillatum]|nr:hypothetical protein DIPPA_23180 [Diplonema papillatum]